jgi:hypothetical protein
MQIGFYALSSGVVTMVLRIGDDKQHYTVEALQGSKSLAKREIQYYDYFTVSGVFLSSKFRRVLEEVAEASEKALK